MKVLFIGSVKFSKITLEELIFQNVNIVGVCGNNQSKFNSDHYDLSEIAKKNNIPFKNCKNINEQKNVAWIQKKSPDIIFCFGWSQLLKKDILEIAPMGCIGFHPAKLPKNRGRHPIIWSLVLGLKETGSTFFFLKEDADSGDIISQKIININNNDDAESLYKKISITAKKQLKEFIPKLKVGKIKTKSQNYLLSNNWRKRSQNDGFIDWRMAASTIHNLVRGLTRPYIGAHFIYQGKEIKVWKTKITKLKIQNIEPGKVISSDKNSTIIKAGIDAIELIEMYPTIIIPKDTYL